MEGGKKKELCDYSRMGLFPKNFEKKCKILEGLRDKLTVQKRHTIGDYNRG